MGSKVFESINPATGESVGRYAALTEEELDLQLGKTALASKEWRRRSMQDRVIAIARLGRELEKSSSELSRLITIEMGKPISQSESEIEKCARLCSYYAEHGPSFLAPMQVEGNAAATSRVRFDPLGAVLAVMPWNFPFWQVFRFAVPALLAGNVGVLKHASNVFGCATAIERLFLEAEFPPGVFVSLKVGHDAIPDLVANPLIQAVTLTGSEPAGRSIAEHAGKHLKKAVLELGGSDPFIVLDDVDLPWVVEQAVASRTLNSGQSCISAKRFLIQESIYGEFVRLMAERMKSLRVGDPLEPATEVGPLAREDLRDDLHDQVRRSLDEGAVCVTGGESLDRTGWFYAPTVLSDVTPGMPAFDEELFGPVAAVIRVKDAEQAIELANRSTFGLGASVWTNDIDQAEQMASRIEAGNVFINDFVKSDPSLPFGGVKNSGFGRELGEFGIREFVNIKTVWVGARE